MEIEHQGEGGPGTGLATGGPEQEPVEAEPVAPLEAIGVPTMILLAAISCAAGEKSRRTELIGVHLCAGGEGEIRVQSSDGSRAFIYSMMGKDLPDWLKAGVTLPLPGLADRIKLIEKLGSEVAVVAYQTNADAVVLSDPREYATFRLFPGKHEFPQLQPIIDKLQLGARQLVDLDSVTYTPDYLKAAGAMAALLDAKQVRVFGTATSDGDPSLFTFPGCPGAILLVMPHLQEERMDSQTARVLDGAIGGTVAALRAHRTRWAQKLEHTAGDRAKKTIENKIAEYDRRIAAILSHTTPALPPPSPDPEAEAVEGPSGEHFDEHAADGKVKDAGPEAFQKRLREQQQQGLAEHRSRVKGAVRQKALTRFYADVNAVLSAENNGLTIHQLADGVPLETWFDTGLDAAAAAVRCLDWRMLKTALPADELGPGEGDLPLAARASE